MHSTKGLGTRLFLSGPLHPKIIRNAAEQFVGLRLDVFAFMVEQWMHHVPYPTVIFQTKIELGDAQLLARYERWRSMDSVVTMGTTDALVRLFGVPGKAVSAIRRVGLGAVQRTGPLKKFFMGEARGEGGDLPKLLAGMEV